jgi:glutaredoxin 2
MNATQQNYTNQQESSLTDLSNNVNDWSGLLEEISKQGEEYSAVVCHDAAVSDIGGGWS